MAKITMVSDVIAELQHVLSDYGDIPCATAGEWSRTAAVYTVVDPWYYDGGCYLPDGPGRWKSTRRWNPEKGATVPNNHSFGKICYLRTHEPEPRFSDNDNDSSDTIDGKPTPIWVECSCNGVAVRWE